MAAWQQLRQQAEVAAAAVAALQLQVQRFEELLLLNDAEQLQQPEEQLAARLDSSEDVRQSPVAAQAGSSEALAAAPTVWAAPGPIAMPAQPETIAAAAEPAEGSLSLRLRVLALSS